MKRSSLLVLTLVACALKSGCAAPSSTPLGDLPAGSEVIATWNFDGNAAPQTQNGWSSALINGKPVFAPGLRGLGVLVEEASQNLLPTNAANCSDAKLFEALRDAKLSPEQDGESSWLRVTGDGSQVRQGAQVFATLPANLAANWAVASLNISGAGRIAVQLVDESNYVVGAPLYYDLNNHTQRVSSLPIKLFSPEARLSLSVVGVGKAPVNFRIGKLQIEPLPSPTSWLAGGTARGDGALEYSLSSPTGNLQQGTLLLWAKPAWTNRTEPVKGSGKDRRNRTFFALRKGTLGPAVTWSQYDRLSFGSAMVAGVDMLHGGWHLIALSWQDKTSMLYIDGFVKNTVMPAIPNTATLTLGALANATLDEAALLGTPLTKEQLDKIFATRNTLEKTPQP